MKLSDNMDKHKISDEVEFQPDLTIDWNYLPFSAENPIFNLILSIACLVLIETCR